MLGKLHICVVVIALRPCLLPRHPAKRHKRYDVKAISILADGEEDFDEAESDLLGDDTGDLEDEDIGDDEWGLDDAENV